MKEKRKTLVLKDWEVSYNNGKVTVTLARNGKEHGMWHMC